MHISMAVAAFGWVTLGLSIVAILIGGVAIAMAIWAARLGMPHPRVVGFERFDTEKDDNGNRWAIQYAIIENVALGKMRGKLVPRQGYPMDTPLLYVGTRDEPFQLVHLVTSPKGFEHPDYAGRRSLAPGHRSYVPVAAKMKGQLGTFIPDIYAWGQTSALLEKITYSEDDYACRLVVGSNLEVHFTLRNHSDELLGLTVKF